MFEGRIPWDLPTELRTIVECLLEGEVRPAIESLRGPPQLTDDGLLMESQPGRYPGMLSSYSQKPTGTRQHLWELGAPFAS